MAYADWIQQRDFGNAQRKDDVMRSIVQTMLNMTEQQERSKRVSFEQTMAQRQAALEQAKYDREMERAPINDDYMRAMTRNLDAATAAKDDEIPWMKSARAWVKETGGLMSDAVKKFAPVERPYEDPAAADARRQKNDIDLLYERDKIESGRANRESYRVTKDELKGHSEERGRRINSLQTALTAARRGTYDTSSRNLREEGLAAKNAAIAEIKADIKKAEHEKSVYDRARMSVNRDTGLSDDVRRELASVMSGDYEATPAGFDPDERRQIIDQYMASPNAQMYPPGEREKFVASYVDGMIAKGIIKPGVLGRVKKQ